MATIKSFIIWLDDISRFSDPDDSIQVIEHSGRGRGGVSEERLIVRLYTATNRYQIVAIERSDGDSYLGAQASSRTPRPGEDHTRGRDLADGPLDLDTWRRILGDIVSFETVRLAGGVRTIGDFDLRTPRQEMGMAPRNRGGESFGTVPMGGPSASAVGPEQLCRAMQAEAAAIRRVTLGDALG